jgi:hypothetical protein
VEPIFTHPNNILERSIPESKQILRKIILVFCLGGIHRPNRTLTLHNLTAPRSWLLQEMNLGVKKVAMPLFSHPKNSILLDGVTQEFGQLKKPWLPDREEFVLFGLHAIITGSRFFTPSNFTGIHEARGRRSDSCQP